TPTPGTPIVKLDSAANVVIRPSASFGAGNIELGFTLDHLDFDGDGRQDLLIAAPGTNALTGGAVVLFGPASTFAATVAIPDDLTSGAAGTTGMGFFFPGVGIGNAFYGHRVAALGKLGDAAGDTRDDFAISPDPNDFSVADPATHVYNVNVV